MKTTETETLHYEPSLKKSRNNSFADLVAEEERVKKNESYLEFQEVLHERVCKILTSTARSEDEKQKKVLNALFNDLTCRLDANLCQQLGVQSPKRYYQVLAEYYRDNPDKVLDIDRIEMSLWDDYHFQIISNLILHLWIFPFCDKRKLLNNLIKSANKLFWLDLEHETRRFQPVYEYLCSVVLSSSPLWSSPQVQSVLLEVFNLFSKFFFYYNKEASQETLQEILTRTQCSLSEFQDRLEFPKGHQKIQTLNMFTNEVVRQLKLLQGETAIVTYLEKCALLRGPLLVPGTKTRIQLQTVLLDYSTPGSPFYPTRKIRKMAKQTIDLVFPGGRRTRQATNLAFRFLAPVELLKSWSFWVVSWITSLFLLFSGLFRSGEKKSQENSESQSKPKSLFLSWVIGFFLMISQFFQCAKNGKVKSVEIEPLTEHEMANTPSKDKIM